MVRQIADLRLFKTRSKRSFRDFPVPKMNQTVASTAKALGIGVGGLTAVAYLALWGGQRQLAYPSNFPPGSRNDVPDPMEQYGIPFEDLSIVTPDGVTLHAFLMLQEFPRDKKTILICHANAGNMGHRVPIAAKFYKSFGYNVFLFSYRGYGHSTGSASEKGLKIDGETVIKYLFDREDLRNSPVVLYGQSLGGAVAIYLAEKFQDAIDALIIENSFTDMPTVARTLPIPGLYYLAPILCTEKWRSINLMPKLTNIPLLFLAGEKDEVIHPIHMQQLWEKTENAPDRVWKSWPNGMHNDTCLQRGYFETIQDFVKQFVYSTPRRRGRTLGYSEKEKMTKL